MNRKIISKETINYENQINDECFHASSHFETIKVAQQQIYNCTNIFENTGTCKIVIIFKYKLRKQVFLVTHTQLIIKNIFFETLSKI